MVVHQKTEKEERRVQDKGGMRFRTIPRHANVQQQRRVGAVELQPMHYGRHRVQTLHRRLLPFCMFQFFYVHLLLTFRDKVRNGSNLVDMLAPSRNWLRFPFWQFEYA